MLTSAECPRRQPPGVLPAALALSALLLLSFGTSAASGSPDISYNDEVSTLWTGTVFLPGGSTLLQENTSVPVLPNGTTSTVSLTLSTPVAVGSGASGITVSAGGQSLWSWPGNFGEVQGFASGPTLLAQNGTTQGTLLVPPATVVSGQAKVESVPPDLTGAYSLSLKVGKSVVFGREGANGYLGFAPLEWANLSQPISIASSLQLAPSGSVVYALGGVDGQLNIVEATPGEDGSSVASRALEAPDAVTALGWGALPGSSTPALLAISGTQAYVIPGAGSDVSQNVIISLPSNHGGVVYEPIGAGLLPTSVRGPSALVASSQGTVFIANYSAGLINGGWPNTFAPLTQLPESPSSFASMNSTPTSSLVAFGSQGQVEIDLLNASGLTSLATSSVAGTATALSFVPGGSTLIVGTSSGGLFECTGPSWTPDVITGFQDPNSLSALQAVEDSGKVDLIVSDGSGGVFAVRDALGGSPQVTSLSGLPTNSPVISPQLQSAFGLGEFDAVVADGPTLWGAESEQTFNSSAVSNWTSVIAQQVESGTSSPDAQGNPMVSIPVSWSTQGGAARLGPIEVDYNYSWTVQKPLSSFTGSTANTGQPTPLQLDLSSASSGWIHVGLVLSANVPSPPTDWDHFVSWVNGEGVLIALGLAAAGAVVLVLGFVMQRRRPKGFFGPDRWRPNPTPSAGRLPDATAQK